MKLKSFKPNKDFQDRTKRLFLAAYRDQFQSASPVASFGFRFKYFVRGAGAGVAVMLILSGAAVYADQKDVGPESVLYSLKRSSEYVNLAFTSEEEKPVAHLSLANRRLKEIENLEEKNPESPKVAVLKNDLKQEITNSLESVRLGDAPSKADTTSKPLAAKKIEDDIVGSAPSLLSSPQVTGGGLEKQEDVNAKMQVRGFSSATAPAPTAPPKVEVQKNLTKNERELCESWSSLLDSREKTIFETTRKYKETLEKIKEQCRSEFNSKNFNLDSGAEMEIEIESEKETDFRSGDSGRIDDKNWGDDENRD